MLPSRAAGTFVATEHAHAAAAAAAPLEHATAARAASTSHAAEHGHAAHAHARAHPAAATLEQVPPSDHVVAATAARAGIIKSLSDVSLGAEPEKTGVADPRLIFEAAWRHVVEKHGGIENLIIPREVVFLSGAPGAGKGTMSGFILKERDIQYLFEVSSLLKTPEMKKLKDSGSLIGDTEVVQAVMDEVFKPKFRNGVVVDGFPRTSVQAECIKLFYERTMDMWQEAKTNPRLRNKLRRPAFSICVLYVDEEESVRRQLKRGLELAKMNRMVTDTGIGLMSELRATDTSEDAARKRYRVFKEEVYAALQIVKDRFSFHFIDGSGSPEEVRARILNEFAYQSSLDLSPEAYEMVRAVDPASSVIKNARSSLVTRLNTYATEHKELFAQVIDLINMDFMHILKRQALAGSAVIRSNAAILDDPVAVNMVLDCLAERGYNVTLDVVRARIPSYWHPVAEENGMHKIVSTVEKSFVFRIEFTKPEIRRND